MTWRFQIVQKEDGSFGVHEVWMANNGKVISITMEPMDLGGFDDRSELEAYVEQLYQDLIVLNLPVLKYEDYD